MLKIETLKLRTMVGFGYWKDQYTANDHGIEGVAHNFLLLFWHYQLAYLEKPKSEKSKASGFKQRLEDALKEQRRAEEKILLIKK